MEKRLNILNYVLLVLSLIMVGASLVANHQLSQFLSEGDPTQLTQLALPQPTNGTPVEITTPRGTQWRYVNFQGGQSLAEFLNNQGEELFGKAAYAQSAPLLSGDREIGKSGEQGKSKERGKFRSSHFEFRDSVTPRVPNMVHVVARHADGTIFYDQTIHNLRTNAGINWQYNQMAGTTAAVCTYIALSNSGATPAATDTALASEITSNGLARSLATASHTTNASSYTLSYTFTATGTQSAQNAGMLNASSSGTLCFENTFSQVNMNPGDTLQVVWTVNF